ncbi:hypothetical protein A3K29_05990 [Candidatus Collierbacteria bacterium RIFOXYB2_FULL_46_14]|uniref:Heavy metal translocating P-type ATPase n=1 Tax=Candidatus Collierbacteria bacterium GW2011_GWA2_46_26 TaxID=1618381 RepID=A0A0G1RQX2_9BACT|nr:MAG: Heavy metal translocating P-type ATPase [Candidatus Collierbacteria bacterium GW2011_GWA2_46_26]OGD73640.1 MAG: hypothetical protein A3K29_05990 [Candidatus Collierbacteria bacterium RIFOXYB2_FULL_46_14]OGD76682.1 MAG: hypothetical protein A3K43_05990 [Candidatus Collierbacteria bacterium RIFOXYA2_FULL_46_20]OGD78018.1 MAG: hypothetical protein A3K39_05990 [Candidatus Collierbacteria bacterium RIFOXYC2_FULL_43_15]OGD80042.1 MAG: hypothetical protein A2320_00420 [Pseudomonadales bacteriu
MFNFFKPKTISITPNTESITLQLSGLHCSSCAVNIDLALEDLPGVIAKTNYAKSETKITFDPSQTSLDAIHFTIRDLGYNII